MTPAYQHTQRGWMHRLVYAAAGLILIIAVAAWRWGPPQLRWLPVLHLAVALLVFVAGCSFHYMMVRDEGEHLAIRYGPLPLFSKLIRYSEITSVEADRTRFIDGWGIHWIPWRGWAYNIAGYGCVKLQLGKKTIRIGSDDVPDLVAFLKTRTKTAGR